MRRSAKKPLGRGPLLGALLRLAHQSVVRRVLAGLTAAGVGDVQSAHVAPMQALWDYPGGLRATELAAKAKITKQSMGELIEQLALRGYLERIPDPEDGRAHRIRLTRHGRKIGRRARKIVRDAEAAWAQRIGAGRMDELGKTLRMLLETETG